MEIPARSAASIKGSPTQPVTCRSWGRKRIDTDRAIGAELAGSELAGGELGLAAVMGMILRGRGGLSRWGVNPDLGFTDVLKTRTKLLVLDRSQGARSGNYGTRYDRAN
jgi:hypothetical protein